MIIYIDADACPVTQEIMIIAEKKQYQVKTIKSYAHFSQPIDKDFVEEIYVDDENEAVDYKIMAMIMESDLLITQDYGLASLALQKNATVIHPRGFKYTKETIDTLLASRYQSAQIRKAGGRTKGPSSFTNKDRDKFTRLLTQLLS